MKDTQKDPERQEGVPPDLFEGLLISVIIGFTVGAVVIALLMIFTGYFANPYEARFSLWPYLSISLMLTLLFFFISRWRFR